MREPLRDRTRLEHIVAVIDNVVRTEEVPLRCAGHFAGANCVAGVDFLSRIKQNKRTALQSDFRGGQIYPNVFLYCIGDIPVFRLKKTPKRLGEEKLSASPICWMDLFSSYSM